MSSVDNAEEKLRKAWHTLNQIAGWPMEPPSTWPIPQAEFDNICIQRMRIMARRALMEIGLNYWGGKFKPIVESEWEELPNYMKNWLTDTGD